MDQNIDIKTNMTAGALEPELLDGVLSQWQEIVDLIAQVSGARAGLIMKITNNTIEVLISSKTQNNPYHVGDRETLLGSGLYCERVATSQRELLVTNALKSMEWDHNPDLKLEMISYLGFPIKKPDGEVFGTICVLDDKENAYTSDLIELMKKMRDLIEGDLYRSVLEQVNAKRKELLDCIEENIIDVIWIFNVFKRKFTYVSPSIEQLRGLSVEEAMAESLMDALLPDSLKMVTDIITSSVGDYIVNQAQMPMGVIEVQQPCKNGEIIWVAITARYRKNSRGEVEIVGVSRNIESRKRAESDLVDSEKRLRTIMEAAIEGIVIIDPLDKVNYWNTAAEKILGYTYEEALGQDVSKFIALERYKAHQREYETVQKTGQRDLIGSCIELQALHKDGYEIDIEISLSSFELQDGWHAVGIFRDISERKRMEAEIKYLASHDPLTGLPNRRTGIEYLATTIGDVCAQESLLAVIYFDLDGFKHINDTLGHLVGDQALKAVAVSVTSVLSEKDQLFRMGGDEFLVIASGIQSTDDVTRIAQNILTAISKPFSLSTGQQVTLSASIGIALCPFNSTEMYKLIHLADEAMYAAKKSGKNAFAFSEAP